MNWITVKTRSGQVLEMVPHVARQLIANGLAEEYKPQQASAPVAPVIETATLEPPQTGVQKAAYVRGPRSRRRG